MASSDINISIDDLPLLVRAQALIAQRESVSARIIAMQEANNRRSSQSYSPEYGSDCFFQAEHELFDISTQLIELLHV